MKARQGYKLVQGKPRYVKYEIPEEWDYVNLSSIIQKPEKGIWGDEPDEAEKSNLVLRSTEITMDGKFDVSSTAKRKIPKEQINQYKMRNGDILVIASSGSAHRIGRNAIFELDDGKTYLFSNFVIRFRSKTLNPKYLYYFLNSKIFTDFILTRRETTSGLYNLPKDIVDIQMPIPHPNEVEKVVFIISNVDTQIQQTQKLIDLTQRLKKGLMQNLLIKGIGHSKFEIVNYGLRWMKADFPKKWEPTPISKLCKLRKKNQISSELYVGLEHIEQGNNQLIEKGNVSSFESNKNIFEKGDILYGKLRPYLNKVWLATEPGYCSTDILALQVNDKILNEFLLYVLSSKIFVDFAIATSSGTKMPRTNWDDIKKFHVVLPSLPEQEQILSILSNVDEQINQHKNEKALLGRIKKGLMQQLLTGQRRVKVGV